MKRLVIDMKSSRVQQIRDNICRKLRARFERIFPVSKKGIFNFRCFENCVQYALDSQKEVKIFECIYIDGGYPVLHYLVKDESEFQEVTIGWRTDHVEFYVVREVPKRDWPYIGSIFESSGDYWLLENTTWFDRAILRIDRVC